MNAAFSEIQEGAFSHLPLLQFLYGHRASRPKAAAGAVGWGEAGERARAGVCGGAVGEGGGGWSSLSGGVGAGLETKSQELGLCPSPEGGMWGMERASQGTLGSSMQ